MITTKWLGTKRPMKPSLITSRHLLQISFWNTNSLSRGWYSTFSSADPNLLIIFKDTKRKSSCFSFCSNSKSTRCLKEDENLVLSYSPTTSTWLNSRSGWTSETLGSLISWSFSQMAKTLLISLMRHSKTSTLRMSRKQSSQFHYCS